MSKTISFNELRRIKDSLPDGTMHSIADRLNVNVQTVRNYFGGSNYAFGKNCVSNRVLTAGLLCSTIRQSTIWLSRFSKNKAKKKKNKNCILRL